MSKKYFWLRLKEDFFEEKYIKALRSLPDGDKLVIIYLKLQLKALKTEGLLKYDHIMPSCIEELALLINEDVNAVTLAINALVKFKIIEIWDDQTLYLVTMQQLIGSESDSAERVRRFREQKNETKALQCNGDVTKCNTEIEIEKEIDIYHMQPKVPNCPYQEIIALFHKYCGEYMPRVNDINDFRKKHMQARWKRELKTLEAWERYFKKVTFCKFLLGLTPDSRGHFFRCDFNWLIKSSTNVAKVLEGNYV